jgi:hypothetical protein
VRSSELTAALLGVDPPVVLGLKAALELVDRLPPGLGAALRLVTKPALLEQRDRIGHASASWWRRRARGRTAAGGRATAPGRTRQVDDVAVVELKCERGAPLQERERRSVSCPQHSAWVRRRGQRIESVEANSVIDDERWRLAPSRPRIRARGDAKQNPVGRSINPLEPLELDGRDIAHDAADCMSVICPPRMGFDAARR